MASDLAALAFLKEHEKDFDRGIRSLSIWKLPLRSVLSGLFLVIDNRFHGDRSGRVPTRHEEAGYAAVCRLSYLLDLLALCPVEPEGESAADALSVLGANELRELATALLYAHFSEVMPEVHRGYYDVALGADGVLLLRHPTKEFAEAEVRDTVMTEVATGFFGGPVTLPPEFFDGLAADVGKPNLSAMAFALKQICEHYRRYAFEVPILTEAGFRAAVGCSPDEFGRFRAAWMALTEFCLGMADAEARRMRKNPAGAEEIAREFFEWVCPYLGRDFVDETLIAVSGLAPAAYDNLLAVFGSVPPAKPPHAGDGFFPPILRFPTAHLFNPDAVRAMLAGRNVAYAINRSNPETFSNIVAGELEPSLIQSAVETLKKIPDVEVVTNYEWGRSEIDILVYRSTENAGVHIQAKGALPAQGARMVQAVETRVKEGLEQLMRLRELPAHERDEVLSGALKREVRGVALAEAVLCRAGVGTSKSWQRMTGVAAINPPLLNGIAKRYEEQPSLRLAEFTNVATSVLNALVAISFEKWDYETLAFGQLRVSIPLMRIDLDRLHRERLKLFIT